MTRHQLHRRLDRLEDQAPRGGPDDAHAAEVRRGVEVIFRSPEAMAAAARLAEAMERAEDRGEANPLTVIYTDPDAMDAAEVLVSTIEDDEEARDNAAGSADDQGGQP